MKKRKKKKQTSGTTQQRFETKLSEDEPCGSRNVAVSFLHVCSTEMPDKFCIFPGCSISFLTLSSIKWELLILK